MSVPLCSIIGCSNGSEKTLKSTLFYFIPKDSRATRWIQVLKGKVQDGPILAASVCIRHFADNAFEPTSYKLKEEAVPTIFPDDLREPPEKKLKIQAEVTQHFKEEKDDSYDSNEYWGEEWLEDPLKNNESFNEVEPEEDRIENEILRLKLEKDDLSRQYEKLAEEELRLDTQLRDLHNFHTENFESLNGFSEHDLQLLEKCFSPAQIRRLLNKKPKWSKDDLVVGYTISALTSRGFYSHLRNELKYPLPSPAIIVSFFKMADSKKKQETVEDIVD